MVSRNVFLMTISFAVVAGLATGYGYGAKRTAPVGDGPPGAAAHSARLSGDAAICADLHAGTGRAESLPAQAFAPGPSDGEVVTLAEQTEPLDDLLGELSTLEALPADFLLTRSDDLAVLESQLRDLVGDSPPLLAELIDRYRATPPGAAHDLLHSLLAQSGNAQVEAFAHDLLASGDVAAIQDGLEILRDAASMSPATRAAVLDVLATWQDDALVRTALHALRPAFVAPAERHEIEQTLQFFAVNGAPEVRAAGVEMLANWSGSVTSADFLLQGLMDEAPNVREAAAFAASAGLSRSDSIRDELLRIVTNSDEEWSVRHHAFNALDDYALPDSDYATLRDFQEELIAVHEDAGG